MAGTVKNEPRRTGEEAAAACPGVVVVHSGGAPCFHVLPLRKGKLVIGREDLAGLHLVDDRVSGRHLEVEHDGAGWTLRDPGSTNGTVVDGVALIGERRFAGPRVARIGRTLLLFVEDAREYALHGLSVEDGRVIGPVLRRTHAQIARMAKAGQGLLLTGASGAGKEVAARVFHEASGRRGATRPFVALNCATVQRELAERILFGARRGAYSGAVADAEGLVQAAAGGTLFLDEIAELEASVQAKLLRVLETREVLRIGATKGEPVEFRLVAATHKDLRAEVVAGRFREDLYFRVGRPELRLAPLRERPEEIPWLVEAAVASVTGAAGTHTASVELVEACLLREWPGNVRELLAEVRTATLLAGDRVTIVDTDLAESGGRALAPVVTTATTTAQATTSEGEVDPIAAALAAEGGNASRAAARLGISRAKVRRFMEKHKL